jgi:pimeloyl-ACP methyl ester carboxylesterase
MRVAPAQPFAPPKFVTVNARKVAYDEFGPAQPVGTIVLIMGLACKRQGWYRQIPALADQYRVIAFDNRDIGDSDECLERYTIAAMADEIAGAMRALDIPRAHVCGISMGGFISQELALRHPALVDHLVLLSTSSGGKTHVSASLPILALLVMPPLRRLSAGQRSQRTFKRLMAPGFPQRQPEDWAMVATLAEYRPQPFKAYRRQLDACLKHDTASRLASITAPTLVIHGERDPLVPYPNGRYLAEHIPGARLVSLPNTGHITVVEQAAAVNQAILAFVHG